MRKTNALGFEMYTMDMRKRNIFQLASDNIDAVILVGGLIAMVVAMGYLLKTGAELAYAFGQFNEAVSQIEAEEDAYQKQIVMEALAEKREAEGRHPVTGAEMPPYWTAPEESY